MQAMILAAGFGTRLLPHTKHKPKPLFPILNTPLLLLTITRLQRFGFDRIIVNCHHLKDQIVEAVDGIEGVLVQEEEHILGTGGGLRKALPLMEDSPLLVTNGDIYHTIDYRELFEAHQNNNCYATLAMHDYPRFNKVRVVNNRIAGFGDSGGGDILAFTGLHILEPEILESIVDGDESCIISRYKELIQHGQLLGVFRVDDCYWTDMGTEQDYLALHQGILSNEVPVWKELSAKLSDNSQYIDDGAEFSKDSTFTSWCSIGKAVGKNTELNRVVVWDGVELPEGYSCSDRLLSINPQLECEG